MKIKSVRYIKKYEYVDDDMADFAAEMWSEGHSFFLYNSDSADALSSCCRLKSGIEENSFSYTLGAGGLRTGSKKVITLNLNRITQDWDRAGRQEPLEEYIGVIVKRVHKYLNAWNEWLKDLYAAGLLTVYSAGYISLEDQYLTVGVNGGLEAAEYLGISTRANNPEYQKFMDTILTKIKNINLEDRNSFSKNYTIECNGEKYRVPAVAHFLVDGEYKTLDYIINNNLDYEFEEEQLNKYKEKI